MDPSPAVSAIAQQIQLSVAPVFLLTGVGAFLNVLANRLSRVVDRARDLADAAESPDEGERARARAELGLLSRRIQAANLAIGCCTTSAILVCLVVAALFIAAPTELGVARFITWLFIAAMALLTAGLVLFLHEVRLAMRSIRIGFPAGGPGPGTRA